MDEPKYRWWSVIQTADAPPKIITLDRVFRSLVHEFLTRFLIICYLLWYAQVFTDSLSGTTHLGVPLCWHSQSPVGTLRWRKPADFFSASCCLFFGPSVVCTADGVVKMAIADAHEIDRSAYTCVTQSSSGVWRVPFTVLAVRVQ